MGDPDSSRAGVSGEGSQAQQNTHNSIASGPPRESACRVSQLGWLVPYSEAPCHSHFAAEEIGSEMLTRVPGSQG